MRWIGYLNLAGVLALALLSAFQWQINSRLNLRVIDLDKTRQEQLRKIGEQETSIKNINDDLNDFRNRLQLAEDELKKDESQLAQLHMARQVMEVERDRAAFERDMAKAELGPWKEAVQHRDDELKRVSDNTQKLIKDRDNAAAKFNELATKYNGVVKDLNEARAKLAAVH